jgi:hypothetical protein
MSTKSANPTQKSANFTLKSVSYTQAHQQHSSESSGVQGTVRQHGQSEAQTPSLEQFANPPERRTTGFKATQKSTEKPTVQLPKTLP